MGPSDGVSHVHKCYCSSQLHYTLPLPILGVCFTALYHKHLGKLCSVPRHKLIQKYLVSTYYVLPLTVPGIKNKKKEKERVSDPKECLSLLKNITQLANIVKHVNQI